jgi:hypothetical protein
MRNFQIPVSVLTCGGDASPLFFQVTLLYAGHSVNDKQAAGDCTEIVSVQTPHRPPRQKLAEYFRGSRGASETNVVSERALPPWA